MNFHDLLVKRRSIRRYTSEKIDADSVRLILEAALLSPTSKSARAWTPVVVEDPEKIAAMAACKAAGAVSLKNCPLAVVVAVDSTKSEAWIEDASIAAFAMQLQAEDLGLGSCWIQVWNRFTPDGIPSEEYIRDLLGIPETSPVLCILTFGHKAEERKEQDVDKLKWENIHIDKW
ncbi:MAG: nitroreductase family protein [Muribaculaceae bacterium]|nr:nitroreductase family protein [Muribaculaceae bacterium]